MQPFRHTFFWGLFGWMLSLHAFLQPQYNARWWYEAFVWWHNAKKKNHAVPTARLLWRAWRAADLAGNTHLLLRSASAPWAGGGCATPGGFRWTKRWPGRPALAVGPRWVGGQTGSPKVPSNWHFYGPIVYSPPAPSKANATAKPALTPAAVSVHPHSVWVSAVSPVSTQVSSSLKKNSFYWSFIITSG